MVYVDMVKADNTGPVVKRWQGPWRVMQTPGLQESYSFPNGHKVHYERVRLHEPRMKDLKLPDMAGYKCLASSAEPIEEIFPQDAIHGDLGDPSSDEGTRGRDRERLPRQCEKRARRYREKAESDHSTCTEEESDQNESEELGGDLVALQEADVPSEDTSDEARLDTDEELWEKLKDIPARDPSETRPLYETQTELILEHFKNSKVAGASKEAVQAWVEDLVAQDAESFVPGLFSDEESTYSLEEWTVDSDYAQGVREERKNDKKKHWLVQQCLIQQGTIDPPTEEWLRGRQPLEEGGEERGNPWAGGTSKERKEKILPTALKKGENPRIQ